jgi:hypothetical protein
MVKKEENFCEKLAILTSELQESQQALKLQENHFNEKVTTLTFQMFE